MSLVYYMYLFGTQCTCGQLKQIMYFKAVKWLTTIRPSMMQYFGYQHY